MDGLASIIFLEYLYYNIQENECHYSSVYQNDRS